MALTRIGGDPDGIGSGGYQLGKVSDTVGQIATGVRTASNKTSGSAGEAALVGAIERFSAAFHSYLDSCSVQLNAAASLAKNGAADLETATGGLGLTRDG